MLCFLVFTEKFFQNLLFRASSHACILREIRHARKTLDIPCVSDFLSCRLHLLTLNININLEQQVFI